jgi:hypothetical protein
MEASQIWDMKVSLSIPSEIDEERVREALSILLDPKGAHEIRGLARTDTDQAYVRSRLVRADNLDAAVKAVAELGDSNGIYYTLNPVRANLGDKAARVSDVLSRRWFLIDIDRVKVKGQPDLMATDAEKSEVFALANKLMDWLLTEGWPFPVFIDSGNGAHLLFRLDLPANDLTRLLLSRALKALAERWNNDKATIDVKVIDASRISKLPGTWVRKGPDTKERPWRLASLLWSDPDGHQCVTVDQLEQIVNRGTVQPNEEPVLDPWQMIYQAPPDRVTSYVQNGLDREVAKVVLSNPGSRNSTLNEAAFAIGQLVGGKFVSRPEAEKRLTDAAKRTGLGDFEIERTIRSGLNAGEKQPRVLPAGVMGAQKNGSSTQAPIPPGTRLIIWAKDVKVKKIEWLWPGRIPLGKMTTFAGQTGMGKTFTMVDIAARVTNGDEIPFYGGECFNVGKVLFISAEDDADDTIIPRFMELGGNVDRLAFLSPKAEESFSLAALDLLNQCLDQMGKDVVLICIDPPTSYLGAVDDHKNAQLRGLLGPLKRFCSSRNVGLIFGTHVNKAMGQNVEAMARVIGSVAWVAGVRAAHMFCTDPDDKDQSLFIPLKVNIAKKPKGLVYKIKGVAGDDNRGTLEWLGEDDRSADEAMGKVKRKSRGVCAVEWLTERFQEKREWESEDITRAGREAGVSRNALWSPEVNALPFRRKKRVSADGVPCWMWIADDGWPQNNGIVGTIGTVDT